MEKLQTIKKSNNVIDILTSKKSKYIIGTLLFCGIGIALPRIFHILGGANSGQVFLPMHIAVLISALVFGKISSVIVGGSSIIFSYLLTGMPTLERLPYMLIELIIYGILLSILNKKFNSYISLIGTIIIGRILYSAILFIAINLLGLNTYGLSVMQSIKIGFPGIIIQLIFVPFIAKIINKGIGLND